MRSSGSPGVVLTTFAAAWLLAAANLIVGLVLHSHYTATMGGAYGSVSAMHRETVWNALAGAHYWASALGLLAAGFAVALLLWNGWHRWDSRALWWSSLMLALLALGLQLTGNLMPMSSHDARTAVIEAGVAGAAPGIGDSLKEVALGGENLTAAGYDRWHMAHAWVLPIAAVLVLFIGFGALRRQGRPMWLFGLGGLVFAIVLGGAVGAPLGPAATPADFGSTGALPMWYVAPLHALRVVFARMSPGLEWVGTMLIPGMLLLLLFALPFIGRKRKPSGPSLLIRVGLLAGAIGLVLVSVGAGGEVQSPFHEGAVDEPAPTVSKPIDKALAAKGRGVLDDQGCARCHRIGNEQGGKKGPNLAGVGSRHDRQWLMEMVKDPASKGRGAMPSFEDLKPFELKALAEYLESLK